MNKFTKIFSLFVIVLLLSIGMVHASELSNDNLLSDDSTKELPTVTDDISTQNNMQEQENLYQSENTNLSSATDSDKFTVSKQSQNRIILNSTSFNDYVTDGQFNDKVHNGDVIDVHGLLDSSLFNLTVNKPVNITSTTNDAFWGADDALTFRISKEGSGTNVSNINFFKTRIYISNTTDVSLDNITNIMTYAPGSGSINNVDGLSENIRITNSYFYSEQIGTWCCNFKVSGVNGLLVENCTFIEVGYCMNNVYLQIAYNIQEEHKVNNNITLRNCILDGSNAVSQAASCGLVMQGSNILIENCSITHNSTLTYAGENYIVMGVWIDLNWGTGNEGEDIATDLVSSLTFRNNIIEGDHIEGGEVIFSAFNGAKIYNNTMINVTSWVGNQEVYNNTFEDLKIVKNDTILSNNIIKGYLDVVNNSIIENNTILGLIKVNGTNSTINNNLIRDIIVNDENNTIGSNEKVFVLDDENVTIVDNQLTVSDDIPSNSKVYVYFKNKDIKILNITSVLDNVNLTVVEGDLYHIVLNPESEDVSLVNSNCPNTSIEIGNYHNLINSTVLFDVYDSYATYINSEVTSKLNDYLLMSADSAVDKVNSYEDYFDDEGYLLNNVTHNSTLLIRNTPGVSYDKSLIINKPIHIVSYDGAVYNSNITFIAGSEGSSISNLTVDANINIYAENIILDNNTITQTVNIQQAQNVVLKNNNITADAHVNLINSTDNLIYNNCINTSNTYTIQIDEFSRNNKITNNTLIGGDSRNRYSVLTQNTENRIYDNYPRLDTNISMLLSNKTVINDTEVEVNVTVGYEKESVSGNLLLTLDGVPVKNLPVVNNVSTKIRFDGNLGKRSVKAYFYPEELYEINTAQENVTVKKINSNIDISYDEVKICENTTITVKVTDGNGEYIKTGNVTFTLNDINITKELENGEANITVTAYERYNGQLLSVYYEETPSVSNNTNKVSFKALKGDVFITFAEEKDGDSTTIIATVKNKLGESITKGFIQFTGPSISKIVKVESNEIKLTINTPAEDTTVSATFRNNPSYENTDENYTIYTTKGTVLTINELNPVYNTLTKITGTLTDENGNKLNDQRVKLIIDGNTIELVTVDGLFEYECTFKNVGQQNITAVYDGTDKYKQTENNIIFEVSKQDVTVTVDEISEVNAGTNVTIKGTFMDSNQKAITNSNVRLYVNSVKYFARTDKNGVYVLSVLVTKVGVNNLTYGYTGNAKYSEYENTTTFNVGKQDVIVTVDEISEVNAGHNVTIKGKFTDNLQKAITNSNVRLYVNGVKYFARTDKNGVYVLSVLVTKVGVNNLTYGYAGSAKYNEFSFDMTFNVGKQDVIVTVDEISEVNAGNNVTISGHFTDNLGKALSNSNVRLYVNGVKYFARTDKNGVYTLSVLVTKVGVNNLTAGYAGNTKYNEYNINTTFNVGKQDVIVTYDTITEVKVGTNVTITGKFTDNLGKAITNSNVRLFVNGVKYLAKTDKTGQYTLSVLVTKVGENNLTVGYGGNAKYNEYNINTTFNVGKQDVIVTHNKINDVKVGQNITVTGKFTDNLGKAITNSNVKIIINGVKYLARTDKTGTYTLTYQTKTTGTNNITVGYGGNAKYNAYETSTTFQVLEE